ncbi:MAG TPA: hypothetical protein VJN64_14940 [Terriglobales bacterium]|nr:hypothetical protein [Terriglobales bacterium]
MIHRAKDLSREQKTALEALLGRALSEEENISIRVIRTPSGISTKRRSEILAHLRALFTEIDRQHDSARPDQAEQIITEALRSTRPGFRSRQ